MALYVKNREVVALVESLAHRTGESKTEVLLRALEDRKRRLDTQDAEWKQETVDRIAEVLKRFDDLPVLDSRSADEILGYDETGGLHGR